MTEALSVTGIALKNIRNEIIEECIVAIEHLSGQCTDLIDPDTEVMHKHHYQAYLQAMTRLEGLREGRLPFPAVRAERLQMKLLDLVTTFLELGGEPGMVVSQYDRDMMLAVLAWMRTQVAANAEARASILFT